MVTVLDQQIADAVIDGDVDVVEELRLEDYELGQAEGRWWVGGTLQISRVRVCATCQRSLDKLNFSRTQWNKKQVGVSRCRECVFSDLEPDLADALASFRAVD